MAGIFIPMTVARACYMLQGVTENVRNKSQSLSSGFVSVLEIATSLRRLLLAGSDGRDKP